jgi:methionyl-tRNA formyltransferase
MPPAGSTPGLRVGFAGTPAFAREALAALLAAGHQVPLVLTQPDRPAGRGLKLQASAVKQLALEHGLTVAQPRSLRLDGKFADDARGGQQALLVADLDVMVVAAYGLILPPWVLTLPRHGCLNIHGSLLPRWRGAAPIQRAIEAGDAQTGITLMQMDAGLDTGAMLLKETTPITTDDTTTSLHDRLAQIGARLMVQGLVALRDGTLASQARPQPELGVTYAHKIDKAEAPIDWRLPAAAIERRIRAFDPFPGATTELAGQSLKVWRARVVARGVDGLGAAGERLPAGPQQWVVACGEGALELLEVQSPGGRRISLREYLQRAPAGPT